jgi:cell division protein FtsQ
VKPGGGGRFWLRVFAWTLAFGSSAVAAFALHEYVRNDSRFFLSGSPAPGEPPPDFSITGAVYVSRARIEKVFANDFGRSLMLLPLEARRKQLLEIDWVEDATVSRLWPNRAVVRIRERTPVAFTSTSDAGGRMALIDSRGVILEAPERARFSFPVLRGVNETQSERQRAERVRAMMRLLKDLGPAAVKDISEVDATVPDSLVVAWQGGGRVVHLILGDRNFRSRFDSFVKTYPEIRKRPEPLSTFDLRIDDRITAKE